jgi:hypothetical protein
MLKTGLFDTDVVTYGLSWAPSYKESSDRTLYLITFQGFFKDLQWLAKSPPSMLKHWFF